MLKKAFDFYINSSIHVSLAVVALALVTGFSLSIKLDVYFLIFLFCSSVSGYNFVKYASVAGLHHRSLARSLRSIQVFSVMCGLGMIFTGLVLRWETLLTCAILALFTLFYAVPLFLLKRNLRSIAGIKVFVIALVWAGTTVVLPVVENGLELYWDVYIIALQRFLIVLTLMIPFEIRDLAYDTMALHTLPQVMGIKKVKLLGVSLLVIGFLLEYTIDDFKIQQIVILCIVLLILGFLITLSRKRQPKYYASFIVEAVPIFWVILLSIAEDLIA
ncbi:hypothetical protein [Dokdonia sinensis]|nr:hypothetical protein [Dokdonia sinensis]